MVRSQCLEINDQSAAPIDQGVAGIRGLDGERAYLSPNRLPKILSTL